MPKGSSTKSGLGTKSDLVKTPAEIVLMAEGGRKLSQILDEVLAKIEPRISTLEIDSWIEDKISKAGGTPSFKFVPRYHWASCVGLNDEVVHSIPRKERIIKAGDLLKVDLGMLYKGLHTDLAWTILVSNRATRQIGGQQSNPPNRWATEQPAKSAGNKDKEFPEKQRFLQTGEKALEEAIKVARAGNRVGHISQKIEEVIKKAGFRPVEVLTGHGVGKKLHEDPLIPGVLKKGLENTPELVCGMTLAIEVIYCLGEPEVVLRNDGWTIVTKDGKITGLFEKTIAITETQPLILTL